MGEGLGVTSEELTSLATDLDDMQEYLKRKVDRLNALVDGIEAGWRSPAARAYTELQRGVNEDAVTIRKNLILIEEAVRMSRDGFDAYELRTLERFQRIRNTAEGEREILDMAEDQPQSAAQPSSPISKF